MVPVSVSSEGLTRSSALAPPHREHGHRGSQSVGNPSADLSRDEHIILRRREYDPRRETRRGESAVIVGGVDVRVVTSGALRVRRPLQLALALETNVQSVEVLANVLRDLFVRDHVLHVLELLFRRLVFTQLEVGARELDSCPGVLRLHRDYPLEREHRNSRLARVERAQAEQEIVIRVASALRLERCEQLIGLGWLVCLR